MRSDDAFAPDFVERPLWLDDVSLRLSLVSGPLDLGFSTFGCTRTMSTPRSTRLVKQRRSRSARKTKTAAKISEPTRAPLPTPQAALVGATLREQRRRLNLTIEEVATRIGMTKGFLSEIERDRATPSVATLLRLRDALSLSVNSLFISSLPRVVRAHQRQAIPFGGTGIAYSLLSAKDSHRMSAIWGDLAPGARSGTEPHTLSADEEIIFVVSGALRIVVDEVMHELGAGDSFTFDPRRPHRYENPSKRNRTIALCLIAPPPK